MRGEMYVAAALVAARPVSRARAPSRRELGSDDPGEPDDVDPLPARRARPACSGVGRERCVGARCISRTRAPPSTLRRARGLRRAGDGLRRLLRRRLVQVPRPAVPGGVLALARARRPSAREGCRARREGGHLHLPAAPKDSDRARLARVRSDSSPGRTSTGTHRREWERGHPGAVELRRRIGARAAPVYRTSRAHRG